MRRANTCTWHPICTNRCRGIGSRSHCCLRHRRQNIHHHHRRLRHHIHDRRGRRRRRHSCCCSLALVRPRRCRVPATIVWAIDRARVPRRAVSHLPAARCCRWRKQARRRRREKDPTWLGEKSCGQSATVHRSCVSLCSVPLLWPPAPLLCAPPLCSSCCSVCTFAWKNGGQTRIKPRKTGWPDRSVVEDLLRCVRR